jgi:hypothetical protein
MGLDDTTHTNRRTHDEKPYGKNATTEQPI